LTLHGENKDRSYEDDDVEELSFVNVRVGEVVIDGGKIKAVAVIVVRERERRMSRCSILYGLGFFIRFWSVNPSMCRNWF